MWIDGRNGGCEGIWNIEEEEYCELGDKRCLVLFVHNTVDDNDDHYFGYSMMMMIPSFFSLAACVSSKQESILISVPF